MSKVTPYPLRIAKCAKGAIHKPAQKKPVSKKPPHPLLKGKRGDGFPLTIAVTLSNNGLASGESEGYLADATLVLEVPSSFAGTVLPPLRMQLRVQAKYIPKF